MPKNIKIDNLTIINKTIDYLKIKIDCELYSFFLQKSPKIFDRESLVDLDPSYLGGFIFKGKYRIINMGMIGITKHRFDILDLDKNKCGNIVFAVKKYKSNISYIELSGLFFKISDSDNGNLKNIPLLNRYDNLGDFFKLLKISIHQKNIIKLIDYNIDVKGREVFQILKFLKKDKDYRGAEVKGLTGKDLIKLQQKKGIVKYGPQVTGFTVKGTYHKLVIYDKTLDIIENYLNRKVGGVNPYKSYIESELPITRIEVTKKGESFSNISDNSIMYIFDNIDSLYFDYLKRFFLVDFSKISVNPVVSLNGKKNFIAKKKKELKLFHSMTMMKAYINNIKNIVGEDGFEKYLFNEFPELQNKKQSDYYDEFEKTDSFYGIG